MFSNWFPWLCDGLIWSEGPACGHGRNSESLSAIDATTTPELQESCHPRIRQRSRPLGCQMRQHRSSLCLNQSSQAALKLGLVAKTSMIPPAVTLRILDRIQSMTKNSPSENPVAKSSIPMRPLTRISAGPVAAAVVVAIGIRDKIPLKELV